MKSFEPFVWIPQINISATLKVKDLIVTAAGSKLVASWNLLFKYAICEKAERNKTWAREVWSKIWTHEIFFINLGLSRTYWKIQTNPWKKVQPIDRLCPWVFNWTKNKDPYPCRYSEQCDLVSHNKWTKPKMCWHPKSIPLPSDHKVLDNTWNSWMACYIFHDFKQFVYCGSLRYILLLSCFWDC